MCVNRIVERPGNVLSVMAVDEKNALTLVNATARRALYDPIRDKPFIPNGIISSAVNYQSTVIINGNSNDYHDGDA